jgi:hypothetical protein
MYFYFLHNYGDPEFDNSLPLGSPFRRRHNYTHLDPGQHSRQYHIHHRQNELSDWNAVWLP